MLLYRGVSLFPWCFSWEFPWSFGVFSAYLQGFKSLQCQTCPRCFRGFSLVSLTKTKEKKDREVNKETLAFACGWCLHYETRRSKTRVLDDLGP